MPWVGPFTIDRLLDTCLDEGEPKPPRANGVYLVSRRSWTDAPTRDSMPLYVGANSRNPQLFRKRVGDLVADVFGFFSPGIPNGGHHIPVQRLHDYCKDEQLNPKQLYIGWVENCDCVRCVEGSVYEELDPLLNINHPPKCNDHLE